MAVLEYMHSLSRPLNASSYFIAAMEGHVPVLQWLLDTIGRGAQGVHFNSNIPTLAATHGKLGVLKWTREVDCPWNEEEIVWTAAGHGHVQILEYLHDECEVWDDNAFAVAAMHGQLSVLQFIHGRGLYIHWGELLSSNDLQQQHPVIVKWAQSVVKEKGIDSRVDANA